MVSDALDTLGTKIGPEQERDAVHVAVLPVEAAEVLYPSQHVGLHGGKAISVASTLIGIVDPFLRSRVEPGEWFWLALYPRTITSLRHEWAHPAITDQDTASLSSKEASEEWLREFIARSDCPDYHTVIAKALNNDSWDSDYLHFDGVDAHGEIPAEFWDHLEIVSGQKITERATYFSCGC